jgi:hypothetical protein
MGFTFREGAAARPWSRGARGGAALGALWAALALGCGGSAGQVTLAAGSYDSGQIQLGSTGSITLTVVNAGAAEVQLGVLSSAGLGLSDPFAYAGGPARTTRS